MLKIRRDMVPMVADYATTFGTDSGLRTLADLEKSFCGSCYTKGDPHDTSYKEGRRDVVERIKYMISLSGLEVEEDEVPPDEITLRDWKEGDGYA